MRCRKSRPACWALLVAVVAIGTAGHLAAETGKEVVATVNGRPLTRDEVDRSIAAKLRPLQQQIYLLRKSAVESLILAAVLRDEAARRDITVEELRRELTADTPAISKERIEEVFADNAEAFASMSPDEARERVRLDLETQERMRRYRDGLALLRERAKVEVLMAAPRVELAATGASAAAGSASAPVTVTEFGNFQCPVCRQAADTLKRLLATYANNVRVVFKHLPPANKPEVFAAARAAVCAAEQNRFWEYHDALFAAPSLLAEQREAAAKRVGLDAHAFADCVSAERSSKAVMADLREAKQLGIVTAPTFVVNGVVAEGALSFAQFQQLINPELEATPPALAADGASEEDP